MISITEEPTIYIHRTKEENDEYNETNSEYRIVTFVNGKRDILQIIKDLIKDKAQA